MALLNTSDSIGILLTYVSANITGSELMTNMVILFGLFVIGLMFQMPFEVTLATMLPVILILMAYSSSYIAIGAMVLILLSIVIVLFFPFQ